MRTEHLLMLAGLLLLAVPALAQQPSFADFDRRARAGEHLTVVFFGASLTWGANASDPINTSYRGVLADMMDAAYPKAHIKYYDAAIGGTGSQLGVFRLDRDVLRRKPDLVFLDFAANDDIFSDNPETMGSYESLVRRIITDCHAPVELMIFPFCWNVREANLDKMKRRDAIIKLAALYHAPVGDAILLGIEQVKAGKTTVEKLWPYDQSHPGDVGYHMFAEAAWAGFQDGVKQKMVCAAPAKMQYPDFYLHQVRVRVSSLAPLPEGWTVGHPSLTAAWHDGLMTRWLDDESIATTRKTVVDAAGKKTSVPVTPARLSVRVKGHMVLLFGEESVKSGRYRVYLDGKLLTHVPWGWKDAIDYYDASSSKMGGSRQHAQVIVPEMDPTVEHTLDIEPLLLDTQEQELRIESICVAGDGASVKRADGK